jgi:NAD(P)-dependent dehydrogenase (short-subunit alcohol dehydrogenase family)
LTVAADVSTEEGNKAMIDAAMAEFGEVHGLFANAGAFSPLESDTTLPGVPILAVDTVERVDELLLVKYGSFLALESLM